MYRSRWFVKKSIFLLYIYFFFQEQNSPSDVPFTSTQIPNAGRQNVELAFESLSPVPGEEACRKKKDKKKEAKEIIPCMSTQLPSSEQQKSILDFGLSPVSVVDGDDKIKKKKKKKRKDIEDEKENPCMSTQLPSSKQLKIGLEFDFLSPVSVVDGLDKAKRNKKKKEKEKDNPCTSTQLSTLEQHKATFDFDFLSPVAADDTSSKARKTKKKEQEKEDPLTSTQLPEQQKATEGFNFLSPVSADQKSKKKKKKGEEKCVSKEKSHTPFLPQTEKQKQLDFHVALSENKSYKAKEKENENGLSEKENEVDSTAQLLLFEKQKEILDRQYLSLDLDRPTKKSGKNKDKGFSKEEGNSELAQKLLEVDASSLATDVETAEEEDDLTKQESHLRAQLRLIKKRKTELRRKNLTSDAARTSKKFNKIEDLSEEKYKAGLASFNSVPVAEKMKKVNERKDKDENILDKNRSPPTEKQKASVSFNLPNPSVVYKSDKVKQKKDKGKRKPNTSSNATDRQNSTGFYLQNEEKKNTVDDILSSQQSNKKIVNVQDKILSQLNKSRKRKRNKEDEKSEYIKESMKCFATPGTESESGSNPDKKRKLSPKQHEQKSQVS